MEESKTEICMLRRRIAELEKQSKKIEELKQDRDEYKEEYIKLQNARYYNYISKAKIKAKIEKLDKEIKVKREIAKNPMDKVSGRLLTDSIVELEKAKSILQSLLKDGGE